MAGVGVGLAGLGGEVAAVSDLFTPTRTDAVISTDGVYRYRLSRIWDSTKLPLVWIMLNPSTADASDDDPTIRRCITFSKREGTGGLEVLNLFALRSTNPAALRKHSSPVGPDNDQWISEVLHPHKMVIAAWGAHGSLFQRSASVLRDLYRSGIKIQCLGVTLMGQPIHPLYVAAERPFVSL